MPASLIDTFRCYLMKRGYSRNSIRNLSRHAWDFSVYLERIGVFDMRGVTTAMLSEYYRELRTRDSFYGRPFSTHTISSKLYALRSFFRYLARESLILMDPSLNLDIPRWGKTPRTILTLGEMEALLSQPDLKTFRGLRDRVMLELFYSTGIRHQEMVDANIQDVDLIREVLTVKKGKGGRDRVVPLGVCAAACLKKYLDVRKKISPHECALFISPSGGRRIYYLTVNVLLRAYAKRAGIEKKVTCHLLRHTCAVHFLQGGADVHSVRELLGHRSLETTQTYLTISPEEVKKVHQKTHPRGKRKNDREPFS